MVMKELKNELNIWTPAQKGAKIMGVVKRISDGVYGKQYDLTSDEGVITLPTHKTLVGVLQANDVKVGDLIQVEFTGEETSANKQKYRTYKVLVEVTE